MLEEYYFVPVFRHAFVNAIGPRIKAKKWQDVFPTITTGYAYPWEDIQLEVSTRAPTVTLSEQLAMSPVHHPAHASTPLSPCSS